MIVTVKKLLIETSCDGLVEIETEPTDDEMRELGWTRIRPLWAELPENEKIGAGDESVIGKTVNGADVTIQPAPLPCGCDTLDFHQMGCPKQKPTGKLPRERVKELLRQRKQFLASDGNMSPTEVAILDVLDERLGRQ